jgi:hypothetical protein
VGWAVGWELHCRRYFASAVQSVRNAAKKYVATHRPESLEWGPFEGLGPDLVEGVRRIKSQDGPDLILWGSSTLTSTLLVDAARTWACG